MTKQKDPAKVAAAYKGIIKKMKISQPRTLIKEDYQRWLKNAAIFFAPAALIFLLALQAGKPVDEAAYAIYLWFLNSLIDLIRKWAKENQYQE